MSQLFKNNAKSRLAAALGATDLSFSVLTDEGDLFPVLTADDHMLVTLEDSSGNKEIVRVSARGGDLFTISGNIDLGETEASGRGREGTTPRGFVADDLVELRLTAGFIDALKEGSITYVIDGGGSAITTGIKGFIEAPFSGTIKSARIFADQIGSIEIDIFKDSYDNYNPDNNPTDSICANSTNPILISGDIKAQDSTLTGWVKQFSRGDIFYFNVVSAATITRATLSLTVDRY